MNEPRSRRFIGRTFVLIVLTLALGVWLWHTENSAPPPSLRPDKTKRAIAARSKASLRPEAAANADPQPAEDTFDLVTLWLRPKTEGSWAHPDHTNYQIEPSDYWPMDDEAPWPEIESADALQALAEALRENDGKPGEAAMRFLEQAEADGLFDHADTLDFGNPWTGLIAMQAEFTETFRQHGFWPEAGTVDFTRDRTIAEHIVETWPDDPAAEYARLHLLQISHVRVSADQNTEEAMEWIEDIILHTQDSLVLAVALGEFTVIEKSAFQAPTIAAIKGVYDEANRDTQRGIIRAMMDHYAQSETWTEVDAWATKLLALESPVQTDAKNPSPTHPQSTLSDLAGYRAARGDYEPRNWREEVSAIAHRCHEDHPISRSLGGEAEWVGRWQWNAWWQINFLMEDTSIEPDAPGFIDCIQQTDWDHEPAQPTLLTVKIIR